MNTYAYARVSSTDQNISRQIDAFADFDVEKGRIFCDKKSGKNFERESYQKLLKKLRYGDLLLVKSIDRLGRNCDQIILEWNRITNIIGADIVVLDMPLLDTRTKAETLVGKFISDIVLQGIVAVFKMPLNWIIDGINGFLWVGLTEWSATFQALYCRNKSQSYKTI